MDGAITPLLVVGAICLVILAWAGRKRFPLRIGAGNFFRRKTQVAIVVAGLLIGTAIITSSYVIQSTFDYTVKVAVFRALDAVDEVVFVPSSEGGRLPFSSQVYDNLTTHLADMPDVAGLAPRYQLPGAVVDTTSQLFEPTATVIGFDSGRDLGDFVRANGSAWNGAGLGATEAIINTKLATAVEAKVVEVFVVLGFFTVIAGVLLIINIFVMLAEERKGEMGVARALGMRRTNLVQSFVSEGLLYALLSSVVGTFTGLLVAGVILWGFSQVFGASAFVCTAAGASMVGWVLSPWKFFSIANADITLFIAAGLMLVLGGLLIVLFNSDSILAVATRLVRGRTWRPVVRTAIAYPMNKKFRTGATLASIALVMFTIATMSGIQAEVSSSITTTRQRESGGFVLLTASGVPIPYSGAAFAAYNPTSPNVTENHGTA